MISLKPSQQVICERDRFRRWQAGYIGKHLDPASSKLKDGVPNSSLNVRCDSLSSAGSARPQINAVAIGLWGGAVFELDPHLKKWLNALVFVQDMRNPALLLRNFQSGGGECLGSSTLPARG